MIDAATADEIAGKTNRFGIGPWLLALIGRLGAGVPNGLAIARDRVPIDSPSQGLSLIVYRRAEPGSPNWSDALVMERASFEADVAALPFGLDPMAETATSARGKLSSDTAGSGDRVSYFMPDARVVELTFKAGGVGLQSVLVARLGAETAGP